MASENRNKAHAVELMRMLEEEPYKFGFFQAIRLLECLHSDKPPVGRASRPVDEPVRLGQEPSLQFAPATLGSFRAGAEGRAWRLGVRFLGLLGPNGPLPLHLTEYARDRIRNHGDHTFARFLDVFHHRMLCLFYRAWADSQPTVSHDRPETDRFTVHTGSLFGLGMKSLQRRDEMPDEAKLHFAGRLACQTKNAGGLRSMLADFFKTPVQVEDFVGRWINLPESSLCRLGASPDTGTLGMTAIIGDRVWDCAQTFRIVIGPLDFEQYQRLLPAAASQKCLDAFVRNYVNDEFGWEVQLILKREEVPSMELGELGQLGWTSWTTTTSRTCDADDLVIAPRPCAD